METGGLLGRRVLAAERRRVAPARLGVPGPDGAAARCLEVPVNEWIGLLILTWRYRRAECVCLLAGTAFLALAIVVVARTLGR
jgi:hypothetical protein